MAAPTMQRACDNSVNARPERMSASPELYDRISEVFPEDIRFDDRDAVR
jgi:hypothetical protein